MGDRLVRRLGATAILVALTSACSPQVAQNAGAVLTPSSVSPVAEAPEGMRLVGLGHVFVAVPNGWGVNAIYCGTPTRDTVVVDKATDGLCGTLRGPDVESVLVDEGKRRFGHRADEIVTVDGASAERRRTVCAPVGTDSLNPDSAPGTTVCAGSLYFPGQQIGVYADSSTSAAEVEQILSRVRVLPGAVGVPEADELIAEGRERSAETYLRRLSAYGLRAKVIEGERRDTPAGQLTSVLPRSGTVLRPGDEVIVFVTAPARASTAPN